MADQHRDYEDYRRGGRREDRRNDEWSNWNDERSAGNQPRRWRSQGDGDSYTDDGYSFAPRESGGYGRGSEFGGGRGAFEASGYGRERSGERDRSGERGYGGFGNERTGYPGDRRFFGAGRQEYGGAERGRGGQESEPWQRGSESQSFGGQRPYARDLYSDSGASRHETDWQSGNAGHSMQSVYTWPGTEAAYGRSGMRGQSNSGQNYGSTFGRHGEDFGGTRGRGGFAGRGPKDYQRSDERIREEICDRMTDDDNLDASDITIQVKQGEVTLAGAVTDREQKRRAEDMAESISGVREVTNNIRVAREQSTLDLNQSPSIQVNQPGQQGSRAGTKAGGGSTPSS